jgi:hypothetical protein
LLPRLLRTEAQNLERARVQELRARAAWYREWAVLARSDEDRQLRQCLAWYLELLVTETEPNTGDVEEYNAAVVKLLTAVIHFDG